MKMKVKSIATSVTNSFLKAEKNVYMRFTTRKVGRSKESASRIFKI